MATHSCILAWRISWTEEPGGLQFMGLQRVGHDWVTNTFLWYGVGWAVAMLSKKNLQGRAPSPPGDSRHAAGEGRPRILNRGVHCAAWGLGRASLVEALWVQRLGGRSEGGGLVWLELRWYVGCGQRLNGKSRLCWKILLPERLSGRQHRSWNVSATRTRRDTSVGPGALGCFRSTI